MKLHTDFAPDSNMITAYGGDWIEINRQRYGHSVVLMGKGDVVQWEAPEFEALQPEHFEALLAHGPELVLLGTGARQRMLHPRQAANLFERRIAIDTMTTHAACRTFNILVSEGRLVLAALIVEGATDAA